MPQRGVPAISLTSGYYKRKYAPRAKKVAAAVGN
jgi:hypothetical protein